MLVFYFEGSEVLFKVVYVYDEVEGRVVYGETRKNKMSKTEKRVGCASLSWTKR